MKTSLASQSIGVRSCLLPWLSLVLPHVRNRTPGGERYRAVSGGEVSGRSEGAGSLRIAAAQAVVK